MNDLRRFLSFLCIPLLFLVGLKQILLAHLGHIGLPTLEVWLKMQIAQVPSSWGHVWWALILLLPVILFFLWLHQRYSGKTLSLDTQAGHSLVIRQKAVERYIRECLMARPFVKDVRIRTKDTRGTLSVKLHVSISANRQIHLLQQQLVEQVVEDAKRGFGISDMPTPDIIVEAVQNPQSKAAKANYAEEKATALSDSPVEGKEKPGKKVVAPVDLTEPTEQQMEAAEAEAVDAEEVSNTVSTPSVEDDMPREAEQAESEDKMSHSKDYTFATLGEKAFDKESQTESDDNTNAEKKEEPKDTKTPEA